MAFEGNINGKLADMRGIAGAGHAKIQTLSANLTLTDEDGVIQVIDCNGAHRNITLPAESIANHPFYFINISAGAYNAVIKDDAAATKITVQQNQIGIVLPDSGTVWYGALLGGIASDVVAYSSSGSAPAGWSELVAARGFCIVGLPNGGTNAGTIGTAFTNRQDKAKAAHTHAQNSATVTQWNVASGQSPFATSADNAVFQTPTSGSGAVTVMKSGVIAGGAVNTSDLLAYIHYMCIESN